MCLYLKYSSWWKSNTLVNLVAKHCCMPGTVLEAEDAPAKTKNKGTTVLELICYLRETAVKLKNKPTISFLIVISSMRETK